jgi:hypothetical protein
MAREARWISADLISIALDAVGYPPRSVSHLCSSPSVIEAVVRTIAATQTQ